MSNICDRCGGVKNVSYEVEFLPGKRALVQHQSIMMKLCMCPVERIKHDGDLGDDYTVAWHYNDINIQDQRAEFVALTPQQALSLLAWLRQEETTLEELAKEQEP